MVTLVTIAPGHSLAPAPAASYARMRALGCPAGITSSWRSPARQAYLYDGWVRRLPGFAFALPPGSSQHERGYALDLKWDAAAWVRAHPEHGWRFTNRSEWWHVDYFLVTDVADIPTPVASGGVAPLPEPLEPLEPEEDMPLNQADLEAIDRIVAQNLDTRLRQRDGTRVPADTAGVLISQTGKEELDRMIANRMDERFRLIYRALGIEP